MAEKFLNLGRGLDIQVHEAKKSLQNFNPKSASPRHIIIKLSPIKNRILKVAREKNFFFLIQRNFPQGYQWISQQRPFKSGKNGMINSNYWKTKRRKSNAYQEHSTQHTCPSKVKMRYKVKMR